MLVDMVIDGIEVPEDGADPVDLVGVLLVQTAQGDQDAFARMYDLISPRVFGLILRPVRTDPGWLEKCSLTPSSLRLP